MHDPLHNDWACLLGFLRDAAATCLGVLLAWIIVALVGGLKGDVRTRDARDDDTPHTWPHDDTPFTS